MNTLGCRWELVTEGAVGGLTQDGLTTFEHADSPPRFHTLADVNTVDIHFTANEDTLTKTYRQV